MSIRKIIVPLAGNVGESVIRASLAAGMSLGKRLSAHVECCCLVADLTEPRGGILEGLPHTAIESLLDEIERRNQESLAVLRGLFDETVAAFSPRLAGTPPNKPDFSADLVQVNGLEAGVRRARLADVVVLASDAETYDGDYQQTLHALLTETGRPLLLVPAAQQSLAPQQIAVAWNGSSEAARAVAMLMDFLEAAAGVTVLTVAEESVTADAGAELAEYLRWHGLAAQAVAVEAEGRDRGTALQDAAQQAGADLLLMGAYTRSRVRRLVFGGASGSILRDPRMPAVMVD